MIDGDDVLSLRELLFLAVFSILLFGVPIFVAWASYNENNRIDMRSLWVYNNQIDKFAVIIMGTWWMHTSSMVLWTLLGKVSTADYATYMGWALPLVAKMFVPTSGAAAPGPAPAPPSASSTAAKP